MEGRRYLTSVQGCLNPLCPHANWSESGLPRWWLRLDDGQNVEFAACDAACAHAGVELVKARLGRGELEHEPALA